MEKYDWRKNKIPKTLKNLTVFKSFPSLDAVYLKDDDLVFIKEKKEHFKFRSKVWEVKYGKRSYFTTFPSGISLEKAVKDFANKPTLNKDKFSISLSARPWDWPKLKELGDAHVLEKMRKGWVSKRPIGKEIVEVKPKTDWIKVRVFLKYLVIVEEPLKEWE
jgi:hypothetical protein